MLSSILGSLVGQVTPSKAEPESDSSAASTAPSTPPVEPADAAQADDDGDPFARSAFFQRLKTKGRHDRKRIKMIQDAALRDEPPKEPDPWECCAGSCGIECVVTMWWEEEKTWRDLRPDWRQIKQRLKDEEEDRKRAEEEEEAISGPARRAAGDDRSPPKTATAGKPALEISLEEETEQKLSL
ncbi:hypothetical protein BMF94_6215 [Rhodotorula taiwanensis]|uniref:Oxidoreductase-like domain-containing protein n=1 Tax=Rhodotorula taiwanensis TaxID=741276 RepID=A0A2S5B1Z1_9BASI|nr:hypothetical protein BMF94_6215 [Rhodotorula taiwanensis]